MPSFASKQKQFADLNQQTALKTLARLAGHRWLDTPSRSIEIITPSQNFEASLDLNLGDQRLQHRYAQVDQNRGIEVVGAKNIAMQDWDWPNEGHIAQQAVTIRDLGDVYESLSRFTKDNPDELWRMYVTPGGVRAFDMAGTKNATGNSLDLQTQLNSDPLYASLSDKTGYWHSRISPKLGREGDFVAVPLASIGTGQLNPDNQAYVRRYHDVPIMENRIANNMLQIPESGYKLLADQAATLPPSAKGIVDPLLSRIYAGLR